MPLYSIQDKLRHCTHHLCHCIQYKVCKIFCSKNINPTTGISNSLSQGSNQYPTDIILLCYSSLLNNFTVNTTHPGYWNRQAYHAVFRMKTLALTVGTKIVVSTLNALVAKTFHLFLTPITTHTNMQLVLTCKTALFQDINISQNNNVFHIKKDRMTHDVIVKNQHNSTFHHS